MTGVGGVGATHPHSKFSIAAFTDGTSNTLLVSEVNAWTVYRRNGPPSTTIPSSIAEAEAVVASAPEFKNTGHTEWPDGRVHHQGFTTLPPNSYVRCTDSGTTYNCDFNSWQEGRNGINRQTRSSPPAATTPVSSRSPSPTAPREQSPTTSTSLSGAPPERTH